MKQKKFTHTKKEEIMNLLSEENDSGRYYDTPEGKFPSVTTVTGWEKRKFFAEWRKNNPEEAKRTTSRGNKLHSLLEKYLNNEELNKKEIDPFTLDLFLQIKPEIDKIDNIHALEVPLYSKLLKLAGRVDCIAEYNGELAIIDFKGSTKQKRKEDIDNYFMQATAYSIMWKERVGIPVKKIVILIACEDGGLQIFESNPVEYVARLKDAIEKYQRESNATV
jgi:ATP-dependent exoDNAse (exonuclease V) beta subunit